MIFRKEVYLDNNATTQLDKRVAKAIAANFKHYGNPSSPHALGKFTRYLIDEARQNVAALINAEPEQIIFTSGGTEANNTVLKGVSQLLKSQGNHIITSQIEHSSVMDTCHYLEKNGFQVTYLPVDSNGRISIVELQQAITAKTILISIMTANNEIGSIQDIEQISKIAKEKKILFHTDAVQAVGKIPVDVKDSAVDFLSYSSHKIYGPKGIGVLYFREQKKFENLMHGGHQEFYQRGGTENLSGITGFGAAARLMKKAGLGHNEEIKRLRQFFYQGLKNIYPQLKINGPVDNGLSGTINLFFPEVENKKIIALLDYYGICASTGSACSEGGEKLSHILRAIGLNDEEIRSSVRFSLGKFNTQRDIQYSLKCLAEILLKDRSKLEYISPLALDESIIFNDDYYLIDVRYNFQRKITSTLPRVKLVDRAKWEQHYREIPKEKNIVLICEYGYDAVIDGYKLKKSGFPKVISLVGGYLAWIAAHPQLYKKYVLEKK